MTTSPEARPGMENPSAMKQSSPRRFSLVTLIILLLFVALGLIPLSSTLIRNEVELWRAAALAEQSDRGDAAAADSAWRLVESTGGQNTAVNEAVVRILLDHHRGRDALKLMDQYRMGLESRSLADLQARLRLEALQEAGDFKGALAYCSEMLRNAFVAKQLTPEMVNLLAYSQALAKTQLRTASREIGNVIQELERRFAWVRPLALRTTLLASAALLVTDEAGQQQYQQQLDDEIRWYESLVEKPEIVLAEGTSAVRDANANDELILLLSVRAYLLDQQGKFDLSQVDRRRVRELGGRADDLIAKITTNRQLLFILRESSAYLDTRGFIRYQMDDPANAVRDFDSSILALEVTLKTYSKYPHTSADVYVDQTTPRHEFDILRRQLAAMLYHRAIALEKLQDVAGAARDYRRRKELGFSDDEALY